LFSKNLKYLLALNKQKNALTRIHIYHELKITSGTLHKWENDGEITSKNLEAVIDYFNEYLGLQLNDEDLLNVDLEYELEESNSKIKEVEKHIVENGELMVILGNGKKFPERRKIFQDDNTRELCKIYLQLDSHKQKRLIQLVKLISGWGRSDSD
jgi:hypothetical protein